MGFRMAPGALILRDVRFSRRGNLMMGVSAVINNGCRIDNRAPVTIGAHASVSYGCVVYTKGHDPQDPEFRTVSAAVVLGPRVWLCSQVLVMPGVMMGEAAVALAGSVVTKDIPAYAIHGGNPARFVAERRGPMLYELRHDRWRIPFFG